LIAAVTAALSLMLGIVPTAYAGGKDYAKSNKGVELMRPDGYRSNTEPTKPRSK